MAAICVALLPLFMSDTHLFLPSEFSVDSSSDECNSELSSLDEAILGLLLSTSPVATEFGVCGAKYNYSEVKIDLFAVSDLARGGFLLRDGSARS